MEVEPINQCSNQSRFASIRKKNPDSVSHSQNVFQIHQWPIELLALGLLLYYCLCFLLLLLLFFFFSLKMRDIIEVVALFLSFVSWILIFISLEDHYWKESTQDGSVIITSAVYENLWMSCASDSTGAYNCRDFPSLFALPGKKKYLCFNYSLF